MAAPFCGGSWGSATPAQPCWEALGWAETVARGGRNLNQKFESAPRYRRNHPPYWPHRRQTLQLAGAPFGGHQWGLVTPAQPCWEPLARAVTVARGQKTELRNSNRRLAPPLPPAPAAPPAWLSRWNQAPVMSTERGSRQMQRLPPVGQPAGRFRR